MSVDIEALKSAQANGLVVGVVPSSGQTALRLEIDDFISDTELANLYFLALEAFMNKDPAQSKDPFSYYEISGIHGTPVRPWDNVSSVNYPESGDGGNAEGYCQHGSVLFPLWHRVYLAQFEQALYIHAADIAERLNAQDVLNRFRLPYWDSLLPRQKSIVGAKYTYGVPIIFTLPQIRVRRPESPNEWTPMDNPLYQFDFPDYTTDPSENFDWSGFTGTRLNETEATKKTIRGYDVNRSTPGKLSVQANHSFVIKTLDDNYNPFTTLSTEAAGKLWRVMLDPAQNWLTMSNHSYTIPGHQGAQSLEGFHDDAHVYLGQGPISNGASGRYYGHMADPRYAGFDPSFWLHHCNIDRLLAIWQGIKSQSGDGISWWTTHENDEGTFVEPRGENETPTTPLAPFRKQWDGPGSGSEPVWWDSLSVRDHTTLGYEYPVIAAAKQTGDLVGGLTRWANVELGWANPSPDPTSRQPGDPSAIAAFEQQVKRPVAAFPANVKIDGRTPVTPGNEYISSQSTGTSGPVNFAAILPQAVIKPVAAAVESVKKLASRDVDNTANDSGPHNVSTTSSVPKADTDSQAKSTIAPTSIAQTVMNVALPQGSPSIDDRFGSVGGVVKNGKVTGWNASFSVEKFALDGSFVIYFFLGNFSTDPTAWIHDPHRAATSAIFSSTQNRIDAGGCRNCATQQARGVKYKDTVGLTQALLEYYKSGEDVNGLRVTDLEIATIVPFLTRNLHWRVVDAAGSSVPRETIPSLKIGVYSETIVLPQRLEDNPRFEDQVVQFAITTGRPGGLNPGEEI